MRAITIKLSEAVLLKQLAKMVYTIGENMRDDDAKMRHFVQSATDEGHIDLILDRMDEAWSDVLKTLTAYTILSPRYPCGAQEACCCTNWDKESEEEHSNEEQSVRYEITLYFPNNTFSMLGEQLVRYISRFILLHAKAEWQALTKQTHSIGRGYGQDYAISEGEATRILSRIKAVINQRTTNGRIMPYKY